MTHETDRAGAYHLPYTVCLLLAALVLATFSGVMFRMAVDGGNPPAGKGSIVVGALGVLNLLAALTGFAAVIARVRRARVADDLTAAATGAMTVLCWVLVPMFVWWIVKVRKIEPAPPSAEIG